MKTTNKTLICDGLSTSVQNGGKKEQVTKKLVIDPVKKT